MSKMRLLLFLGIGLLVFAAGCAPECELDEYSTITAVLDTPNNGAVLDYQSQPTLDWELSGSCLPEYYRIKITRSDGAYGWITVPGETSQATMESSLLPGLTYEWFVEPFTDDGEDGSVFGNRSQTYSFTADGRCSGNELVPPTLVKPADGRWIDTNYEFIPENVNLKWDYPGDCFPESYHYQLAADPDFNSMIASGVTEWDEKSVWVRLPECARIYWRVEARTGTDSGGYSDPWRFTAAKDFSCWQNQASIDAALVSGFVFNDECGSTVPYVPEGVDIWPPCAFGEPYGVHGDGNRTRGVDGEPGISDVYVDLGAGPCPSTGLDQFITTQNGSYYFMVQSPGQYCISVDKNKNPDLENGIWTLPLTDEDVTGQTITLDAGDMKVSQDFGWDQYDYARLDFDIDLTSICRLGDSTAFPEVDYIEAGQTIPVFARNEEGTWFATIVNGKRCYISIASGSPQGDPGVLEIFPDIPLPEPVAEETPEVRTTKTCPDYKNEDACLRNGCEWVWFSDENGACINPP